MHKGHKGQVSCGRGRHCSLLLSKMEVSGIEACVGKS